MVLGVLITKHIVFWYQLFLEPWTSPYYEYVFHLTWAPDTNDNVLEFDITNT